MDNWYVYLIDKKGKLYIGVTTDMENRMRQHGVKKPLYRERPFEKHEAAKREKQIKKQESGPDRLMRKARKIRARLGASNNLMKSILFVNLISQNI